MATKKTKVACAFKVGDKVRREAFGWRGTVVSVHPLVRPVGGVAARVKVVWDNGGTGTVEDRNLFMAEQKNEEAS